MIISFRGGLVGSCRMLQLKKKLDLARITVGGSVDRMVGGGLVGAGIDGISTTRFAFNFCTPLTM